MKRILIIILSLLMLGSLCACRPEKEVETDTEESTVTEPSSESEDATAEHVHNYTTTVIPPSCTEGYTVYSCEGCGDSYSADYVAALGHVLHKTVIPSACTQGGYTHAVCTVCGYEYDEEPTEATGHQFGDWEIREIASLTQNGTRVCRCRACDFQKTETYEHAWNASATKTGIGFRDILEGGITCEAYLINCTDSTIRIPSLSPGGKIVTVVGSFKGANAEEILIPETVAKIGYQAFHNCRNLRELHIPQRVTLLGALLAENSPNLKTVYFHAVNAAPDTSYTEAGAFTNSSVETVIFGEGVQLVPTRLFSQCKTLRRVELGSRVTSIAMEAFHGTTALTEVVWNGVLKEIHNGAFCGSGLTSLTLPPSLESIGTTAFADLSLDCEQLLLGERLQTIGEGAFQNAGRIGKLLISSVSLSSKSTISQYFAPFYNTTVESVELAPTVTRLSPYLLSGVNGLREAVLDCNMTEVSERLFVATAMLEKVTLGDRITSIGEFAFSDCASLHTVEGFENVRTVRGSAFAGCSSLKAIDLSGVTTLESFAFSHTGLEAVTLPNTLEEVPQGCFANCTDLKRIQLPEALKTVGFDAFASSGLEEIDLPDSVTEISGYAFRYCVGLERVKLPRNLKEIAEFTFDQCTNLKSVELPATLESIGSSAFFFCSSLESLILPDTVSRFGDNCFSGCSGLKEVRLSDSMTTVPDSMFSYCSSLESVRFPANLTSVGSNAFCGTALKQVILPDSCKTIGHIAFYQCAQLESVDFGGVTEIEGSAFSFCSSLREVILPDTVESIGAWAFHNCSSLTKVYLGTSLTFLDYYAFRECTGLRTVYLPQSLLSMKIADSNLSPFQGSGTVCYVEPPTLSSAHYGYFGSVLCGYTYEQYLQAIAS